LPSRPTEQAVAATDRAVNLTRCRLDSEMA
jgi:hypothetical protein